MRTRYFLISTKIAQDIKLNNRFVKHTDKQQYMDFYL